MAKKKAEVADAAAVEVTEEQQTKEQQAVIDAAAKVAEAKTAVDEATADHVAAVEEHAAAVEAAKPPAEPTHPDTHIGIDHGANGTDYSYVKVDNWARLRTHNIGGKTVEHVADDANGVWLYRKLD